MLKLIYYYPLGPGAPSEVSRSIFSGLIARNLPFSLIVLPQHSKGEKAFKEKYNKVNVLTFKDLFRSSTSDVVHFTMSPLVFPNRKFLYYLLSLLNRRKFIINYHGDPETEFRIKLENKDLNCLYHFPNYILTPFILKSADTIIVNSMFMENLFRSRYDIKNIVVIPNGIDSSWINNYNFKKEEIKEKSEPLSLFYHGRLAPEKGVDILIESIYRLIKKHNKSIKLYIAGEGTQEKNLKELCTKLEIEEDVSFLGYVSIPQLKSYLCSVDAAVYPSIYEPFSLAVLEALSTVNGPVIYSNRIGINDFVLKDGFNFYTFEPSVEGITDLIKMIIEKKYDEKISDQQKEFASKYTWEKVIDKYLDIYSQYL